jgi:hypothetical protein
MKKDVKLIPIASFMLALSLVLFSCKKDEGCTDSAASNFDSAAEVDDGSCEYGQSQTLQVPTTYSFADGNGNSTVSFNGQAQRLEMLQEITSYCKEANTSGTAVSSETLLDMYANANGYVWALNPDTLGMTGSSKNLKSKTASSSGSADPAIQEYFEGLMTDLAAASMTTVVDDPQGADGVAGVVVSTTNPSKMYLQAGNGHEWTQLIEKGLMGACLMNQISAYYLSDAKMDVDNSTAVNAAEGKYYTEMEHHWDEAYGYFTTAKDYPTNGANRFWGKYAGSTREEHLGTATAISDAFRTGRAAIVAQDYVVRDAQIAIIQENMELVAVGTAIHYLNDAMGNFGDAALRNHELSEAVAFMQAIPYGHDAQMTMAEVNAQIEALGSFYTVSLQTIQDVKDVLVSQYSLQMHADAL